MLLVRGHLLSYTSRDFKSRKDGKTYTFYTGYFLGSGGGRPVEVEFGTDANLFKVGYEYELEVYVRCYGLRSGGFGYQLMRPKEGLVNHLKEASHVAA